MYKYSGNPDGNRESPNGDLEMIELFACPHAFIFIGIHAYYLIRNSFIFVEIH